MKTLLSLLALTATSLSAFAGQIIPPSMLVTRWARTMNRASYTPELDAIDYAKINKLNPVWTKDSVNKLFASIDADKVKFMKHDSEDKVITMEEPFKIRFTFEVSQRAANPAVKYDVTTFYTLVGIERIEEKKAQQ